MGRTSADITIHRIDGTTFKVPITTEARRTFGLGREDNIRLKWDDTTPYRARVGDWVNDELFGLFYVTEEQEPTVDSATGAYRHDIRFDRDYIGWKNVLHMLTYSDGGSIVRKETDWSLTDTLANHLKAVKDGLSALKYTMATSVMESGVDNSDSAVTISFAGTSVYNALNTIADAYRCEWWVTYNSDYSVRTIHMGKMELSGSAYPITLGDNAEDITSNKSDAETANRVYAFGSTRNIPDTYRKTLSFSVTDTATRTSDSRSATVFRDSARVVRQDMLRLAQSLDFDLRLATPAYETNAGGQRYKAVFTDAMTIDRIVRYAATGNLEYTVEFVRDDASESTELEGYAWELRIGSDIIGSGAAMFSNHERVLGRAVKTVSVPVDESLVLQPGSTEARFSVWTNDGILVLSMASANSGVLSLKAGGYGIDCPLTFNGNTYTVTFNPLAEEITTSVFNWFAFSGQVPSGFAVGSKYTLGVSEDESAPGLLPLKIPVSFYTDDMGSLSVMKMIGERRLMLPTSTPGYVERGDTSVNRVVEKVVVFDNEYPKLCLQITEIEEGAYTDNTEWSDGSRSYGTLPKYTIKVKRVVSGGSLADFPFKSDYLTTEPLKAVFMTRDEAVGHGAVPPSTAGFKLSGMTFGLNFSAAAQTYTIAFNEDYGAKLPNGILKPQVGDCLLLTGWNVAALTSLGLVSASEDRLLSLANDYIDALQAPSHTYRCRMMSDSMMEDGLLEAGKKVVITRDNISDPTRVIGFEYKLDIPEDTPVYECGETETYSRLRALEKALNARSQSVSSSSGTLTSSYSQSGSESQPSQPASLTGKLYWKGGAVTDFEGDDFDGSEDKTLTVPTDISHLSGSGTLPRIGKVKETLEDGTKVIDLLDDSGTKLLPSANIDWFIVEELTENEVTTYRLKLNPKYEGMYAEGWVSAGGVSEQGGGGGGTGYLRDLLDVNASMSPTQGQALVWDDALGKWTAGDVSVDLTPFERIANRVTTVSSSSNHTQYPTAKAVYDIVNTMLSSAMRFQGVTSTALVDGSTTNPVVVDGASYTATRGDVVVRSDVGLEYLWTGARWQQLGDETSYAKKTVTITGSGYLTGGGNLEAARTIDIAEEIKTKIDNGATAFGYFTDGAANEAIKLRTARKLWGRDFDGTGNVDGQMTVNSNLALKAIGNANYTVIRSDIGDKRKWQIDTIDNGARWYVDAAREYVLNLASNGNVGIGTDGPAYKLDVNGDSRTSGKIYIGTSGGYLEVVNVGTTASPVYALKSSLPFYSDSWVSAGGVSPTGSGGGITGYLKDLLDVNGSMTPVDGQALVWDSSLGDNGRWTSKNVSVDLTPFERTTNKVTSISASSTDGQYPSARAVYNALSSKADSSALSGYLPLTGGTLNSGGSSPTLTLNTSAVDSAIKYQQGGSDKAWIGYNADAGVYLYNCIRSRYLSYKNDGSLLFENNKVWHAGNDGAGSGLDADLLDGWQGERYVSYNEATLGNNVDFNEITYKRGNSIVIQPIHVTNYSGQTNVPFTGYGQMLTFGGQETLFPFRIAHSSTYSKLFYNSAGYKAANEFNFSGGAGWKEIAFTTTNVASATKLQTARKIWGQDFDGGADVDGILTGVNSDNTIGIGTAIAIGCPDVSVLSAAGNGVGITMGISGDSYYTKIATVFEDSNPRYLQPALAFYTMYNSYQAGSEVERMRISANGNVGFGTPSPAHRVDVAGDSRISGKVYIGTSGGYLEVVNVGTTASPVYALKSSLPFFSDSWVSAGGVSSTGSGGGITGYLKDLLDVNGSMTPVDGQALVWDSSLGDNGRWTSKNVSVDLTPFERTDNKVTSISASSTDGQYPSARAVYNSLSGYLPLTGGTLTGLLRISSGNDAKIILDNTDNETNYQQIVFSQNGTEYARLGTFGDTILKWQIGDARYKIWHAGNDGAGSGLDADLLDGWQGERYVSYNEATLGNNVDFNEITYKRGNSIVIQPIHVTNYSGQTNVPFTGYGQMLTFGGQETLFPFRIAHSSTYSKLFYNSAGYKAANEFNFSGGAGWKEIAFTTTNVASATKLQTARKIWGQDFDGTGNVSGAMTGVTTVNSFINAERGDSNNAYLFMTNVYAPVDYAHIFVSNSDKSRTDRPLVLQNGYGNVGVGIPNPAYKVDVAGDVRTSGKVYIGTSGGYLEVVNVGTESAPEYALHTTLPFYSDSFVSAGGLSGTGGSGSGSSLRDLSDVQLPEIITTGSALVYNGEKWVQSDAAFVPQTRTVNGLELSSDISLSLGDLSSVNTAGASNGLSLMYNDGEWTPGRAARVFYGTCSTGASATNKIVDCEGFTTADLVAGTIVIVYFTNASDKRWGNATLQVGATNAVNIWNARGWLTWDAGETVPFYYCPPGWQIGTTKGYTAAHGYNLPVADADTFGAVRIAYTHGSSESISINSPSTTAGRYYYVESNGLGRLFVNVPWTGGGSGGGGSYSAGTGISITNNTISVIKATTANLGGVLPAAVRSSTPTLITGETESNRYYGVEMNSSGQLFVNVPWTGGSGSASWGTTSKNTSPLTVGGTTKTVMLAGAATARNASPIINTGGTTANRYYGVEISNDGKLFVNVPWLEGGGSTGAYLPIAGGTMEGTINSQSVIAKSNNAYDLGSSGKYYANTYTKKIYLDDGVYIYYDSTNRVIRVQGAGIAATGSVNAGGVSNT